MASTVSATVNISAAASPSPDNYPSSGDSTPRSADDVVVASVVLTLLIAVTISGNVLVCVAFHLCRPLRSVTNYFVVSLAVADLLVGFVCMPFWFLYLIRAWPDPASPVYTLWICLDIVSGTASIMNLAAIAIDRYCAITFPFKYSALLTKKRACLCIGVVWVYALIVALLHIVRRGSWYSYFVATASFFVPLPAMIFSYIRILGVALKQARTTIRLGSFPESYNDFSEASPPTNGPACSENGKRRGSSEEARKSLSNKSRSSQSSMRQMRRRFSMELKAAKTLAIVMGTFIFCWAPFIVVLLLMAACPRCSISASGSSALKWLHYSNSAMNPVIYTALNRSFRDAFRRILCRSDSSRACACCTSLGQFLSRSVSRSSRASANGVRFSLAAEVLDRSLVVEKVTVVWLHWHHRRSYSVTELCLGENRSIVARDQGLLPQRPISLILD